MTERPAIDPRFHSDLTAEDELGVVVRAHIHIEASVIEFVCARVLVPDAPRGFNTNRASD